MEKAEIIMKQNNLTGKNRIYLYNTQLKSWI